MSNRYIHKKSSVASKAPISSDIFAGEISINLHDQVIFSKDTANNVFMLSANNALFLGGNLANTYAPLANPVFTGTATAPTFTSTKEFGSAPLIITSNTVVSNLNADYLDGQHGIYYTANSNFALHTANTSNPHNVTKAQVGLGNVTNESKLTLFSNPIFTGNTSTGNVAIIGSFDILGGMSISSNNLIINLNADYLDGKHGSYYTSNSSFGNLGDDFALHTANTSNPHSVTKAQVGLGNVTDESKLTLFSNPAFTGSGTANNFNITGTLQVTSQNNVSNLNADYLDGQHGIYYTANSNFALHTANTSNPHAVSSVQVGLGNVSNQLQQVYHGWVNRTTTTLAFDNLIRTFTLVASPSYDVYIGGTKYTYNTTKTVAIGTGLGQWFIWLKSDGTLATSQTMWSLLDLSIIPLVTIHWDGSFGIIGDERHDYREDVIEHNNQHDSWGAQYVSGFTTTPTFGPGATNTFSFLGGVIRDEDLRHTISGTVTTCQIGYRVTGGASMTFNTESGAYAKLVSGGLVYDNNGILTSVTNNNYGIHWIYATNRTTGQIVSIVGQGQYTTVALAHAAPLPTLNGMQAAEWKLLYRVICRRTSGVPFSFTQFDVLYNQSTGPAISSGSLTTIGAGSVTYSPSGSLISTNVQSALDELDTKKAPIESPSFTGTATANNLTVTGTFTANGANLTNVSLVTGVTGILPVYSGGTGIGTYTSGDLLYANSANTMTKLSVGSIGTNLHVSASGVPEWTANVAANKISLNTSANNSIIQGEFTWTANNRTFEFGLGNDVVGQGFQEIYHPLVYNNTISDIPNGTVVGYTGVDTSNGNKVTVAPFIADGTFSTSQKYWGVATETINSGTTGFVTYFGEVGGVDTHLWPIGTILYASDAVAGSLTDVQPETPSDIIIVGTVIISAVNGKIEVRYDSTSRAYQIPYDNNTSGLIASNLQTAVDELQLKKVSVEQLSSTITIYPTNVVGSFGYYKMVSSVEDADYNVTAVDVSSGAITTTDQLVTSLIADANLFIGNPGVINLTTLGEIRKDSGNSTKYADFFFRVYKIDVGGTETLITTSVTTGAVNTVLGVYNEFSASALLNDGVFLSTDRIVIKYYSNLLSGTGPTYSFKFGGINPTRTLLPVPVSVIPFGSANNIIVSTSNFNHLLTGSESTVQLALDRIDDHAAPLASPNFTGTVVLPSTTSIGNVSALELGYLDGVTANVQFQLDSKSTLDSPAFIGIPSAPTANNATSNTQIATTAFVHALVANASITLTGDVTSNGSITTLATVNANTGTYGSSTAIPVVTVNAKGLVTGVSTATVAGGQYFGAAATKAIAYNSSTISENVTITSGNNGLSAGPITITNSYTVTIESGSNWTIVGG